MRNRILKESICRSEEVNSLTWFEEVLFYRLIVACDDYGRFDGRAAVIKGYCFPLKDVTTKDIGRALERLAAAGLVRKARKPEGTGRTGPEFRNRENRWHRINQAMVPSMGRMGGMTLDKTILQEYLDACELVKETEKDIRRLEEKRKTVVQTKVKGSMNEFPYVEQHFSIQGTSFTPKDDSRLRREERLLELRRAGAEEVKFQVEEWMLSLSSRMQRIVKYRYLDGLSWVQTAMKMGRNATADSVRMELERFLREK